MLHYSTHLHPSSKTWVTFVHGAGGSSSIWFKQLREFSKYFNVLLLDLRGHGKSRMQLTNVFKRNTLLMYWQKILLLFWTKKTSNRPILLGFRLARF